MQQKRDLQHRFPDRWRDYVIEICAPGRNPAPVSAGPFEVHVMADAPDRLDDPDVEPEKVVRHVIDYVTNLVPVSVTADQWASSLMSCRRGCARIGRGARMSSLN